MSAIVCYFRMNTLFSSDPSFSVSEPSVTGIQAYLLVTSCVMGHLQVITLADCYFIAPESAANHT